MKNVLKGTFILVLFALFSTLSSFSVNSAASKPSNAKEQTITQPVKLALEIWVYIGPQPATINDITNPANWVKVTINPCGGGTKLCAIQFDTANTTLEDALGILADNWPDVTHGGVYSDGTKSVQVFLKS